MFVITLIWTVDVIIYFQFTTLGDHIQYATSTEA